MFSVHMYTANQATSTTPTAMAAAADPIASVNGNFLYVPILNNLFGAYGLGAHLSRVQLQSPSILADVPYDMSPVDTNALPASPLPIEIFAENPRKLVTDEPLQLNVVNTTNEQETALVFLSDGPLAPVTGNILRVRATFTSSTTANAWVNATITLTNQLAEGTYNLVGARFEAAHGIAGRFVFQGGPTTARPGCPAVGTATKLSSDKFRDGKLGVWGTFSNRVLPTVDFVSDGNSETVVLIMDLIKTS